MSTSELVLSICDIVSMSPGEPTFLVSVCTLLCVCASIHGTYVPAFCVLFVCVSVSVMSVSVRMHAHASERQFACLFVCA